MRWSAASTRGGIAGEKLALQHAFGVLKLIDDVVGQGDLAAAPYDGPLPQRTRCGGCAVRRVRAGRRIAGRPITVSRAGPEDLGISIDGDHDPVVEQFRRSRCAIRAVSLTASTDSEVSRSSRGASLPETSKRRLSAWEATRRPG